MKPANGLIEVSSAQPSTILIVEDNPGIAELERLQLERAGFDVLTAETADGALYCLDRHPVDLILLDYRLPGDVDGLDFHVQLKEAGFDIPVILVTGYSNEAMAIEALRAGIRDFVTKSPEYLDYLPEAVNRVLKQVQTERQLAETEARLTSIIDSAKDAIIITDEDHCINLFNPAAEQMFRCPASEALGQPISRFVEQSSLIYQESQGTRLDGTHFPLEASLSQAHVDGRIFHTLIVRDITSRKEAEETKQHLEAQLQQSQKMEAFGQLAGGVAHDFNNLLTIISGYSEILRTTVPDIDSNQEYLHAIRDAGQRAAALTRQLLAFSRQTVLDPKVVDLNEIVADTERMLRRLIGEDVILTTKLDHAAWQVYVDPGLVGQVLMNLAVNSRDAMPQGGTLSIETRNEKRDSLFTPTTPDSVPGAYVLLAVSDTGCGMTPEVKARIFEPFFTTKAVGKGTGLGLAVVHGIVAQSNGQIEIDSTPGQGTTFRIYLPAVEGPLSRSREMAQPSKNLRGQETILLVEDENTVRELASLVLRSYGYHVVVAENGSKALEVVETHEGGIDLLLTDVVMPNLSGRQVAEALQPRFPRMKVLYMSGYTDDAMIRHGLVQDHVLFLQKPTTPLVLAAKVRNVLDSVNEHPTPAPGNRGVAEKQPYQIAID